MDNVYYGNNDYRDYLMHHGIKGQKWGVRRYQNEDGTLTAEGKARLKNYKEREESYLQKRKTKIETKIAKRESKGKKVSKYTQRTKERIDSEIKAVRGMTYNQMSIEKKRQAQAAVASALVLIGSTSLAAAGITPSTFYIVPNYKAIKSKYRLKEMNKDQASNNKITKTKKAESNNINDKIKKAKSTNKYDMEFLERGLDTDQKTGRLLEGKELDKAYEKYLKEKYK